MFSKNELGLTKVEKNVKQQFQIETARTTLSDSINYLLFLTQSLHLKNKTNVSLFSTGFFPYDTRFKVSLTKTDIGLMANLGSA